MTPKPNKENTKTNAIKEILVVASMKFNRKPRIDKIVFSVLDGLYYHCEELCIYKKPDSVIAEKHINDYSGDNTYRYPIKTKQWDKFINELYGKHHFSWWNERYFSVEGDEVYDDLSYSVEISYSNGHTLRYHGGTYSNGVLLFERLFEKHFGLRHFH